MSEPSTPKSDHRTVTIALIGATATIAAALIGLAPTLLGSKPGGDPAPARAVTKEDAPPRPLSASLTDQPPVQPVRTQPPAVPSPERPKSKFSLLKPKAPAPEQPPIKVTYRPSKIPGQGMVAGLTNGADRELKNIVVQVRSADDKGERSYRVARSIRPADSISVGWKELDGWKLKPGDRVSIKAEGYAAPVGSVVPRK